MGSDLIFCGELLANRSFLGNLFRILSKMIIAFLTLLLVQYSFADNKECRRAFGKEYKALEFGSVEGDCQYTKSCLKCMKGFRMHDDQYCEPISASSQARVVADMAGGKDPCQKRLGANHTAMYPGACMFKGCFLCLNGGEVGLGDDGLPACVLPADPSERRRRSVENSPVTAAPTTAETPLTRSASAPLSPHFYSSRSLETLVVTVSQNSLHHQDTTLPLHQEDTMGSSLLLHQDTLGFRTIKPVAWREAT